jgi:hypothetical protein
MQTALASAILQSTGRVVLTMEHLLAYYLLMLPRIIVCKKHRNNYQTLYTPSYCTISACPSACFGELRFVVHPS